MKKRKIDLTLVKQMSNHDQILFIRPYGSKVYRVTPLSEEYRISGQFQDIEDILNAVCIKRIDGVWYFADTELIHEAILVLYDKLNIDTFTMEAQEPAFGMDENGNQIQSILN